MADRDYLVQLLVISNPGALERRKAFIARARKINVPWRFFDARTGLPEGLRYDADAVERNKGRQLTKGEIGCYSSHYAIWQDMVRQNTPQCIILEDDTLVDWAFLSELASLDFAAMKIPYMRLYSKKPGFFRVVEWRFLNRSRSLIEYMGYVYGTQAYVITQEGARAFLSACAIIQRPLDDQMDRSWEHGIRNLALFPAPIIEEHVPSIIGDTRFQTEKSALYYHPRQRLRRWLERQTIRVRRLGFLLKVAIGVIPVALYWEM